MLDGDSRQPFSGLSRYVQLGLRQDSRTFNGLANFLLEGEPFDPVWGPELSGPISLFCSGQHFLNPYQSPCPYQWPPPPRLDVATTMLLHWDGIGQVMSSAWFPLDKMLRTGAKQFNLVFIRPENLFFSQYESPLGANSKPTFMFLLLKRGLHLAALPQSPDQWSATVMVVHLKVSDISSQALWSSMRATIGFLDTSLTKSSVGCLTKSSVGCSKLLLFKKYGCHSSLPELSVQMKFFGKPSPDLCLDTILSLSSAGSSSNLMVWLFWYALFILICIVSCDILKRQVCPFPNYAQSIEFDTGGLQSQCRDISKRIKRNAGIWARFQMS